MYLFLLRQQKINKNEIFWPRKNRICGIEFFKNRTFSTLFNFQFIHEFVISRKFRANSNKNFNGFFNWKSLTVISSWTCKMTVTNVRGRYLMCLRIFLRQQKSIKIKHLTSQFQDDETAAASLFQHKFAIYYFQQQEFKLKQRFYSKMIFPRHLSVL